MKLCRFDNARLGIVEGDLVFDASKFLERLSKSPWPDNMADPVIERLDELARFVSEELDRTTSTPLADATLSTPVPRPSKIIGAPVNFHAHLEEARADHALHQGQHVYPIDEIGLFLKANSALVGPDAVVTLAEPTRRSDHEAEVVVVIGKTAKAVSNADALDYVGGYMLGLDLSIRGKEDRSMRKSPDGYAVAGPYITTPEEISNPSAIEFSLSVNGQVRQRGSTALLIRSVSELVEMASRFYTLYPGDLIFTGTPEGVSALSSGDNLQLHSPTLGKLTVDIA